MRCENNEQVKKRENIFSVDAKKKTFRIKKG